MTSSLMKFYSGEGTDDKGRTFIDIINFTDEQLESTHDYIQWLFPNFEASRFNTTAPVLTGDEGLMFVTNYNIRSNAHIAFKRIMQFYGLAFINHTNREAVVRYDFSNNWVTIGNHNHYRMTRILKFLNIIGMHTEADALFAALAGIYSTQPVVIGKVTLGHWLEASKG